MADIAGLPASQFFGILLTGVGTIVNLAFSIVAWVVRNELRRAYDKIAQMEKDVRYNEKWRIWAIAVLAIHNLIPPGLQPPAE